MQSKKYILFYFFIILHWFIESAYAHLEKNSKLWLDSEVTLALPYHPNLKLFFNPQFRFVNEFKKFGSGHFDAAILYQIQPHLSLWLGGARIYSISNADQPEQENRLWQQLTWNVIDTNRFQIINRSRLEERERLSESQIALRFRGRIRFVIPLDMTNAYSMTLADEIFLNLNHPEWVSRKWFSQNRASIGLLSSINHYTSYEIGYLNQFQFNQRNQMSNVVYLKLFINH